MQNSTKTINFAKYSSIKIGCEAEVLVINEIGDYSDYQILGRGNNILVTPSHPKFAVLGEAFDYIRQEDDKLYVGCATKSGKLLNYARKHDLANMEFLGQLPGCLGGLIKMNAGLKEWEIFNYIHSIKTKDGYVNKQDVQYGYRYTNLDTIVYEVVFNIEHGYSKEQSEMFKQMRSNQPHTPSAGSCFKNPEGDSAGRLIDAAGLRGYAKGNMAFSEQHANFLVNLGGGTHEEALFLIELAKKSVLEKFGVKLQEEIIIF